MLAWAVRRWPDHLPAVGGADQLAERWHGIELEPLVPVATTSPLTRLPSTREWSVVVAGTTKDGVKQETR
jgi:hypothetical protein